MKPKKTGNPVPPEPANIVNPLPLKEQLKHRILDRYDLQELFNVSRNTILNWCKAGIISYTKIGRKRIFDAEEIDALLRKRKETMRPGGS